MIMLQVQIADLQPGDQVRVKLPKHRRVYPHGACEHEWVTVVDQYRWDEKRIMLRCRTALGHQHFAPFGLNKWLVVRRHA